MHESDRWTTSGLVLDADDDPRGEVLRAIFGAAENVPRSIKTAHPLTPGDRARLPDDLFALVLVDGDRTLRKYACVDAGHTQLSSIYFLKNASKLPAHAQKVAARNLATASRWYGLAVPEPIQKLAIGVLSALTAIPVMKGTAQSVKSNMSAVRALEGSGHKVVTPDMRTQALKMAESSGTPLMPQSEPQSEPTRPVRSKTVPVKTAGAAPLPDPSQSAEFALHPYVDIRAADGPMGADEKRAHTFALGDRYPLDNYLQVETASRYFDAFGARFTPEDRATYARAFVKKADALGIAVSDAARKYASTAYAPLEEVLVGRDLRRNALAPNAPERMLLHSLYEKRAEIEPEAFCDALGEFDRLAGLACEYDRAIPDPYASTYGFEKDADFRTTIGNDTVTGSDLERFARTGKKTLEATFNTAFVDEFAQDPIGIFKSLPRDEQVRIMRMATDTAPGEAG